MIVLLLGSPFTASAQTLPRLGPDAVQHVLGSSAHRVWPGGSGWALTGNGVVIHQWEAAESQMRFYPDTNRASLRGKVLIDSDTVDFSRHATELAEIMVGQSDDSLGRGIAYEAQLVAHDLIRFRPKMEENAEDSMGISLHAYDQNWGWNREYRPFWGGIEAIDSTEDYHWGRYNKESRFLDSITWKYPRILAIKSAGNSRGEFFSGKHRLYKIVPDSTQPDSMQFMLETSEKERKVDGGAMLYDCLSPMAVAKNTITVGACYRDSSGHYEMMPNSGSGPTDDGRIKPDVVAMGEQTSQAAAVVAGVAALLQQRYSQKFGERPSGAMLRNLLVAGAAPIAGHEVPHYWSGWGRVDAWQSAALIDSNHLLEGALEASGELLYTFEARDSSVNVTLCWNDPPGWPVPFEIDRSTLNNRQAMLVHDLDLRVIDAAGKLHYPFFRRADNPDARAQQGNNDRDNVEQIRIRSRPGARYQIVIKHSGALQKTGQPFALSVKGGVLIPNDHH